MLHARSVGEFQAWFRNADCLGLVGVVVMARWLRLRGLRPMVAGGWAMGASGAPGAAAVVR